MTPSHYRCMIISEYVYIVLYFKIVPLTFLRVSGNDIFVHWLCLPSRTDHAQDNLSCTCIFCTHFLQSRLKIHQIVNKSWAKAMLYIYSYWHPIVYMEMTSKQDDSAQNCVIEPPIITNTLVWRLNLLKKLI